MKHITVYLNEYLIKKKLDKPRIVKKITVENFDELVNEVVNAYNNTPKNQQIVDLNHIDISNLDTLNDLSQKVANKLNVLPEHLRDINVSTWDTSSIKHMCRTFMSMKNLDCDFSYWDVSNVEECNSMFNGCVNFTGKGLENWRFPKCRQFMGMFLYCFKLNNDLSNWDMSSAEHIGNMFNSCYELNFNASKWNTSKIKYAHGVFENINKMRVNVEGWDMSSAVTISDMFHNCKYFEQDLSNWGISNNLVTASSTFENCFNFDCDLSKWDVSGLQECDSMFCECDSFSHDLSSWNLKSVESKSKMFYGCTSLPSKFRPKIRRK